MHFSRHLLFAILALGGLILLAEGRWFYQPTLLERIRDRGELVVVTTPTPSTIQHTDSGPGGLDHDLIRAFANQLGVDLRLVMARSASEVYRALVTGHAQLATGMLVAPERNSDRLRFTRPYLTVEQQVISRFGNPQPDNVEALADMDGRLVVPAGSPYIGRLRSLAGEVEGLQWEEINATVEELLYQVWNNEAEFTIADSHQVMLTQRHYPELRVAFSLSDRESLAWAFPADDDDSLYAEAQQFLDTARANGKLAQLQERYFGHLDTFDYVAVRRYLRHITERLPRFRDVFRDAARETGVDWRLLAALSYQESHWDPSAVSPTGVRGLMMLTQRTAGELGVNRLDPVESIHGGARYIRSLRDRLPDRIEDPVRTWLALAAYNVGMGHLEDARILTESRGENPDTWTDIKETLPLLAEPEWHSRTRYGYARGWEPVVYVTRIRAYYDILMRVTDLPDMSPMETAPTNVLTFQELENRRLQLGHSLESAF